MNTHTIADQNYIPPNCYGSPDANSTSRHLAERKSRKSRLVARSSRDFDSFPTIGTRKDTKAPAALLRGHPDDIDSSCGSLLPGDQSKAALILSPPSPQGLEGDFGTALVWHSREGMGCGHDIEAGDLDIDTLDALADHWADSYHCRLHSVLGRVPVQFINHGSAW